VPPESEQRQRQEVGQRIKSVRQARGMTVQQLAQAAGMSPGYLSEVERGLSAISFEKLVRLAEELKVTTDFLKDGKGAPEEPDAIRIPTALSAAAEQLGLSYRSTIRLLEGRESLVARRSQTQETEWSVQQWINFYERVKEYLPDA
jgi:transcriptional regulator with XRE-family HTH domain